MSRDLVGSLPLSMPDDTLLSALDYPIIFVFSHISEFKFTERRLGIYSPFKHNPSWRDDLRVPFNEVVSV